MRLAKQRLERGQKRAGQNLRALGRGMDSVPLDSAGNVDEVLVNHGDEGDGSARGSLAKDLIEGVNVVGAVVRRECDAAQENSDVGMEQSGEHFVEILPGGRERQSAKTVVAAELDDDHGRVQAQNGGKPLHGVLGGGAAGAEIDDLIAVAQMIQVAPQGVRIRLAGCESVTGGDTVTKADEDGLALGRPGGGQQDMQEGNKKCAANVHRNSVFARQSGWNGERVEEAGG